MNLEELREEVHGVMVKLLDTTPQFSATQLGLDERASYMPIFRGEDFLACRVTSQASMEYYGGFEYARDFRTIIGNYVFWSTDSKRVAAHWEQAE